MTTIYVRIIRNDKTGYEEVFRTTKPGYIPKGHTLVKELQSFTIGGELPYGKKEEPQKVSPGCAILMGCVIVSFVILVITFFNAAFSF